MERFRMLHPIDPEAEHLFKHLSENYTWTEILIRDALNQLGVPTHVNGHGYFFTGIKMVLENGGNLGRIMKLYEEVGAVYNISAAGVERGMRHAIDISWDRISMDNLDYYYGSQCSEKPSNGNFIKLAVTIIAGYLAEE